MHGHGRGPEGMMQWKDMLMDEMWDKMTDEQKKAMIKRKIEGKILAKELWIKHLQFKIETLKMARKMVEEF